MKTRLAALALLPLAGLDLLAQAPVPRTAPRATWSLIAGVTGTPTQRRQNHGAASLDRLYVFGGRNGNANTTTHNALYEFDGLTWTLRTPDTTAAGFPQARGGAAVAWNFTTGKLYVFGGDTGTGLVGTPAIPTTFLGDTWEWDPVTNVWTDVTPVAPALSPAPRRFSAMTWDSTTGGMLLFGGADTATTYADTWLFLAGAWIPMSPATTPPVRREHSLVTRRDFQDIVMCSGVTVGPTSTTLNAVDVWRWTGSDWQLVPTTTIPHGCAGNQAVYDEARKRIVLQGGNGLSVIETTNPLYTNYGGSPSGWCSEFDSFTNEWTLYGGATSATNDTVIGRISRYFIGYVPSLGKVIKWGGQNPSGVGTITGTCQYQANPVAAAVANGTGCAGLALAADTLPWTGRTFSATGSGLAPGGLCFGVFGFSDPATPLSVLAPIGGIGCTLSCSPDATYLLPPSGGSVALSLTLPPTTSFGGLLLKAQVLQLQFDTLGNPSLLTSSNGLALTIGAL